MLVFRGYFYSDGDASGPSAKLSEASELQVLLVVSKLQPS